MAFGKVWTKTCVEEDMVPQPCRNVRRGEKVRVDRACLKPGDGSVFVGAQTRHRDESSHIKTKPMKGSAPMPVRTSLTDPLVIATIPLGKGALGITICPGKNTTSQSDPHNPWARDLDDDLDGIAFWGADTVITLITPEEAAAFGLGPSVENGLSRLGEGVLLRQMNWVFAPIVDRDVPDVVTEAALAAVFDGTLPGVRAGKRLLVHCNGGLGRAGSIAAFALTRAGMTPEEAITTVRAARGPGAIETPEQEAFVARGWT